MNQVYAEVMPKPYPNRATVVVAGLLVPGARIEIVAQGIIQGVMPETSGA